jgi:hypothetical protein
VSALVKACPLNLRKVFRRLERPRALATVVKRLGLAAAVDSYGPNAAIRSCQWFRADQRQISDSLFLHFRPTSRRLRFDPISM